MILMDTGPLVALFDLQDPYHKHCSGLLKTIREPLITTIPVLTEVFHLLSPDSQGSKALRQFIDRVFTIDRNDFFVYRVAVGHELRAFSHKSSAITHVPYRA